MTSRDTFDGTHFLAASAGAVPVEAVRELQRERDHLLLLHDALVEAERAATIGARLEIFVDAIRKVGFGRVALTLRDANMEATAVVGAGLTDEELGELRANPASGATWRQRLAAIERFRVSDSYYLDGRDPWVASAFGGGVASRMTPSPDADWSPNDALLVPLRGADGTIIATLLLDDPADRARPSLTRVRTVELFGRQVAAMLERAALADLAEHRAARLQKLHETGSVLARSLDEDTILRALAREVENVLPGADVAVFATDDAGVSWPRAYRRNGYETDATSVPLPVSAHAARAADARRVVVEGQRVAVPAILAGSVLGVVTIEHRGGAVVHPDDVDLLLTIGGQAAAAMSNARMYAESQRQRRQTEALADVSRAVGESLRLEQVLRLILRHAIALLRTDGASISLQRGDALEVVAGIGTGEALVGLRLPVVGSLNGRVVRSGKSFIGTSEDPDAHPATVRAAGMRNLIIVPLSAGDQGTIGALSVFNRVESFTSVDANVLERLADQVAVAVVNARLFEEATEQRAVAEQHRLVVETSRDAIVITDRERRIAFANPAAIDFFGYGESLIGMPVWRTLPPDMRDLVRQREDEALAGQPQRYEGAVVRADGERRIVAIATAPLREGGEVTGTVASLRDITEERRARDAVTQSEARYRNLFDSASDSIYTLDLEGNFTSVNEATVRMCGRPRTELLAQSSRLLFDEEDAVDLAHVVEQFRRAVDGESVRYECHFRRSDGERRLISVTNTPIRAGTQIVGVLGVARDVTDERARAAALVRSEARYTRLVESASDAIFTVGRDGCFTAVNRALEMGVGRPRTELIDAPISCVLDARDVEGAEELLRKTFAGERCRGSLRYRAADGEVRNGSVITAPVFEDGAIVGVLGIMRDVTEEQRLAAQLLQQEKLAAVGQLVSGVAHELNNPLAGVMAFSELLLASRAAEDDEMRRGLETIHHESVRAAKIVSHLLTFARQRPAERMEADLNAIVNDTLALRRYAFNVAGIELDVVLDPTLPRTWADPYQLQQVVLNLFTNAEQALAGWQGPRRVAVWTRYDTSSIMLAVSDSGPGIPAAERDQIFNPFFTTKPVGEGTGLGLSISDGIVREHGGQIRVESHPGEGATFIIQLPRVAVAMPAVAAQAVTASIPRTGRRVLVVDDEPTMRAAISTYLGTLGDAVDTASTPAEARALLASDAYDVVLLDLRMAGGSGDALFRELEQRDPRHASRVVFVTGDAQSEHARTFLSESGRPSVIKPFQLDDLAAVLARMTT